MFGGLEKSWFLALRPGWEGPSILGCQKHSRPGKVASRAQTSFYACGACYVCTTRRLEQINRFRSGFGGFSRSKMAKNGDFGHRVKFSAVAFWAHFEASVAKMVCQRRCLRLCGGLDRCLWVLCMPFGACVRFRCVRVWLQREITPNLKLAAMNHQNIINSFDDKASKKGPLALLF